MSSYSYASSLQLEKRGSQTGQSSPLSRGRLFPQALQGSCVQDYLKQGNRMAFKNLHSMAVSCPISSPFVRPWAHEGVMIIVSSIPKCPAQGCGKQKMVNRFLMKEWNEEELIFKNGYLLARLKACVRFLLLNSPGVLYSHRPHGTCLSPCVPK